MSLLILLLFVKLLPLLPLSHVVVESSPTTLGVVDVLLVATADADAVSGALVLLIVEHTGVDNGIDVFAPTPEPSLPLAVIGVGFVDVDVDDDDLMVKIGRLYSNCASERGPPLTREGERERERENE